MNKSYTKYINSEKVYFFTLLVLAVSLPFSPYITSVSQFILIINAIVEGDFKGRVGRLKANTAALVFMSLYAVHLLWLINTSDFAYGLHDIKIKLPLLVLPLIIGSSKPLEEKQLAGILKYFVFSMAVAALFSFGVMLLKHYNNTLYDIRSASIIISYIRFSLYIVIAYNICLYYFFDKSTSKNLRTFYLFCSIWLAFFCIVLQSLSGIMALLATTTVFLFWRIISSGNIKYRLAVSALMIIFFTAVTGFIAYCITDFYDTEKVDIKNIDSLTVTGNRYYHNFELKDTENGYYTWLFICEKEMIPAWHSRSDIDYFSKDNTGQYVRATLIRYLTSKGLRKDSTGIAKLNDKDIINIENGVANHICANKFSIRKRMYEVLWEFDSYIRKGEVNNHSLVQRIEYLRTAARIINDNFWFGTGTGDVKQTFKDEYKKMDTILFPEYQNRAHNQYVTFFLSFGIIGFILSMTAMFYPAYISRKKITYLVVAFLITVFLSMFSEDTLESQAGVTLFSYFYSLFILMTYSKK